MSLQVNKNVKFLRKARGFTQDSFALALGVKRPLIGSYEENRAAIRSDLLPIIAKILSIDEYSLLNNDLTQGPAPTPVFQSDTISSPPRPDFRPVQNDGPEIEYVSKSPIATLFTSPPEPLPLSTAANQQSSIEIVNPTPEPKEEAAKPLSISRSKPVEDSQQSKKIDAAYLKGENLRIQTVMLDSQELPLVSLVSAESIKVYQKYFQQAKWVSQLDVMSYPAGNPYTVYRAFEFESGKGQYVISSYERNWLKLAKGTRYLVVLTNEVLIGTLSEAPSLTSEMEMLVNGKKQNIAIDDLLEIWKVVATLNTTQNTDASSRIDRLAGLLETLQEEIIALKAAQ